MMTELATSADADLLKKLRNDTGA